MDGLDGIDEMDGMDGLDEIDGYLGCGEGREGEGRIID